MRARGAAALIGALVLTVWPLLGADAAAARVGVLAGVGLVLVAVALGSSRTASGWQVASALGTGLAGIAAAFLLSPATRDDPPLVAAAFGAALLGVAMLAFDALDAPAAAPRNGRLGRPGTAVGAWLVAAAAAGAAGLLATRAVVGSLALDGAAAVAAAAALVLAVLVPTLRQRP